MPHNEAASPGGAQGPPSSSQAADVPTTCNGTPVKSEKPWRTILRAAACENLERVSLACAEGDPSRRMQGALTAVL